MYFLSLFGYICMFVFVESLSLKFDICTMSDNEGYYTTSEVYLTSTIRSLKTDV